MDDSILDSVKKILNIPSDDTYFDLDIIMHINTALMILFQLGATDEAKTISDNTTLWSEVLIETKSVEAAKTYVALKVRSLFDPPLSSAVAEALNKNISELESRIIYMVDTGVSA